MGSEMCIRDRDKAVELKLIDGYCIGALSAQQVRTWLRETTEAMPGGSAR